MPNPKQHLMQLVAKQKKELTNHIETLSPILQKKLRELDALKSVFFDYQDILSGKAEEKIVKEEYQKSQAKRPSGLEIGLSFLGIVTDIGEREIAHSFVCNQRIDERLSKLASRVEVEKRVKALSEKIATKKDEISTLCNDLIFLKDNTWQNLDSDYDKTKLQRSEIKYKLMYPYLHQSNLLDTNTQLEAELTKPDFDERLCYQIQIPLDEKEVTLDQAKYSVQLVEKLLLQNQKTLEFNLKGVLSGFFKPRYVDPRIKALENLISNPAFKELSSIDQLNLIINEVIAVENLNSVLLQLLGDKVSPANCFMNLPKKLVTLRNPNLDNFITAIKTNSFGVSFPQARTHA